MYVYALSVCSKRFASLTGQENFASGGHSSGALGTTQSSGALSSELELLKQEILTEMKRELQQVKQEIIDGEWQRVDSTNYTLVR